MGVVSSVPRLMSESWAACASEARDIRTLLIGVSVDGQLPGKWSSDPGFLHCKIAEAEADDGKGSFRFPLRGGDFALGTFIHLGSRGEDLKLFRHMKEHVVGDVIAKALAGVRKPIFARDGIVVLASLVDHDIFAAIGDFDGGGFAFLERRGEDDGEVGIKFLAFLHPVEWVAFAGSDLADAQRGIEVERKHGDAILFGFNFDSGDVREETALLDGHVEILVKDFVSGVVLVAAGRAVCVLAGAMEGEGDGLGVVHRVPAEQRDLFRGDFVDAVRVEEKKEMRILAAVDGGKEIIAGGGAQDILEKAQVEVSVKLSVIEHVALVIVGAFCVMTQERAQLFGGFCVGAVGLAGAG